MTMKTYLITGGAGFIGSHLAETLIRQNQKVIVVDDLSTGNICNLDGIRSHDHFQYVYGSIIDEALIAELVDRSDAIFHLAAAVGVKLIFENPVETIRTNIRGTEIILDLAARKSRKVQIASTSEVYGKGVEIPFRENSDLLLGPTTCPRWAYACSKAIDEFLALAYTRQKQTPTFVTRFFNTVGPRQTGTYGMVIPRFVGQAIRGEPITVYGDGSQSRCFVHVDDVVGAVIELMETDRSTGEVYNIGNASEITINELAGKIIGMTGGRSTIQYVPFEEAYGPEFEDMDRRVPDVSKLAAVVDWSGLKSLEDILQSVINSMRAEQTA
jgi:UDP-glucose 4-epimerase